MSYANSLDIPYVGIVGENEAKSGEITIKNMDSREQQTTMKTLERASGFVRRLLSQRLDLRVSPEVRFVFDPSVEYSIRLESLIEETKRGEDEDEPDPDPET